MFPRQYWNDWVLVTMVFVLVAMDTQTKKGAQIYFTEIKDIWE